MYRKRNREQISVDDFIPPFGGKLSADNRWVKLARVIPWDQIEERHAARFGKCGNVAIPLRVALGALIIREKCGFTDEETVLNLSENNYMQYFVGYTEFRPGRPFAPSLMVEFLKRIDMVEIQKIIDSVDEENRMDDPPSDGGENRGTLMIDATCAPADIRHPTDLGLLNEGREKLEVILDTLWGNQRKKMMEETSAKVSEKLNNFWYFSIFVVILVLRVFFWFSPSHAEKINNIYLWPLAITSATVLLARTPSVRRLKFSLPAIMAVWLWIGCIVNGDAYLIYNRGFILGCFLSFISSFLLIPSLNSELHKLGFQWIALLYCSLMLILASLGLYTALTGDTLMTPLSDESIHLVGSRLFFFRYHPNEAGSAFVVALYLLLYLFASYKKRLLRIVFVLAGAAFLWVISFTGSRTAIFLAAAGVAALAFTAIEHFSFPNRVWLRWIVGLFVGAAVMIALYFGISLSATLVYSATPQGAENTPQQSVTTILENTNVPEAPVVQKEQALQTEDARTLQFQDISTFNNRAEIWRSGLDYLKKHPLAYLFGVPDNIVARIPQQVGRAEMHMHNAYLEMLLLGGIPGLVMYLFFLAGLAYSGIRLVIHRELNWGLRYLGIVPFLIAANGVTEIYPLFSGNVMDMMYFVIAGAVITFAMDLLPARQRLLQKV